MGNRRYLDTLMFGKFMEETMLKEWIRIWIDRNKGAVKMLKYRRTVDRNLRWIGVTVFSGALFGKQMGDK